MFCKGNLGCFIDFLIVKLEQEAIVSSDSKLMGFSMPICIYWENGQSQGWTRHGSMFLRKKEKD